MCLTGPYAKIIKCHKSFLTHSICDTDERESECLYLFFWEGWKYSACVIFICNTSLLCAITWAIENGRGITSDELHQKFEVTHLVSRFQLTKVS